MKDAGRKEAMMNNQTYETYFNTQNETLTEFYRFVEASGYTYEPLGIFETQHINYDTHHSYHLPLVTKKGNPARKMGHAFICRLSSGRYELTMYIN